MKITRCKLSKKVQIKLLEFFVAQVTARTASDLLGIQHNSAALFYRKIRLVIEYNLNLEAHTLFDGEVELDESYFGGIRKGKRGRGAGGKTAVFVPVQYSQTPHKRLYYPKLGVISHDKTA